MAQSSSAVVATALAGAAWRKSRYSNPKGNCVELAELPAGEIAVRNSRYPDGPALIYTRAEIHAFIQGAKDGEFDDLTPPGAGRPDTTVASPQQAIMPDDHPPATPQVSTRMTGSAPTRRRSSGLWRPPAQMGRRT